MLLGINPIFTFIVCVIPRILTGWLCGLIFQSIKKIDHTKFVSFGVASLAGPLLNTILFMSTLLLFFYQSDFIQSIAQKFGTDNIFAFVPAFVGLNGLIETVVCFVLGTAITKALNRYFKTNL